LEWQLLILYQSLFLAFDEETEIVYSKPTQFTQEDGERLIYDEYVGQKIRDFYKI
jgi:hypothetical protein